MLQQLKVKLTGVCPLLMHNIRLANPMDEYVREIKALTGLKGKAKTDEVRAKIAELEFMGGMYSNENGEYILPSDCIEGTIKKGAMKEKQGQVALAAVYVMDDFLLTKYNGPKDPHARLADKQCYDMRMATVQQKRVLRTRPKFTNWEASGTITFDAGQVDEESIKRWLSVAGQQCGVGDYRPKFGRFEVEFLK